MLYSEKADLRREMRLYLKQAADSIEASSPFILDRLRAMDAFRRAWQSERLMSFVSMPLEIDTRPLFTGKSMIVPYCVLKQQSPQHSVIPAQAGIQTEDFHAVSLDPRIRGGDVEKDFADRLPYCELEEIVPFRILSFDELEVSGTLKILEPKLTIRQDATRAVLPEDIDVVLVPGLAFDQSGNRLGRGKGYYDRFLRRLLPGTVTIGLALEAMIRDTIPHDGDDYPVNMVVTESRVINRKGL
jgi:5-formyltetrahydrofolate cyclo-ligase